MSLEHPGTDDAAAQGEEGLEEISAPLVAGSQPLEPVQPSEGALDDPTPFTRSPRRSPPPSRGNSWPSKLAWPPPEKIIYPRVLSAFML